MMPPKVLHWSHGGAKIKKITRRNQAGLHAAPGAPIDIAGRVESRPVRRSRAEDLADSSAPLGDVRTAEFLDHGTLIISGRRRTPHTVNQFNL